MRHMFDGGRNNRFIRGNQEQRAALLKGLSEKSLDELRHLVVEFQHASVLVHFSTSERKLFDRVVTASKGLKRRWCDV